MQTVDAAVTTPTTVFLIFLDAARKERAFAGRNVRNVGAVEKGEIKIASIDEVRR